MILELFKKSVLPLGLVGLLVLAFYPVCTAQGELDVFLLWILVGFPFGIGRMFLWLVPKNFGLGASLGVFALNVMVGGLIGGVVVVIKVVIALINLIVIPTRSLVK